MKLEKLVLSALLVGATISAAQAQTTVGKMLLSGRVNYFSGNRETTSTGIGSNPSSIVSQEFKQSGFNFIPQAGYFVADNLALGLSVGVGSSKQTDTRTEANSLNSPSLYTNGYKSKNWYAGPFVRYYTMLGDKLGFYGQLTGGYQQQRQAYNNSNSNNPESYTSEVKSTGGYASIMPGFVFFPTPKIGLELTMGSLAYSRMKDKSQITDTSTQGSFEGTTSNFGADFGIQSLSVGGSWHFGN